MTLAFDAEKHEYRLNGALIPHVTGILAPLTDYSRIPAPVLERARQEGRAIHKMVELDCLGTLDVATLPEWMAPAFKAWCDFKAASGFSLVLSEFAGCNPPLGYAGTLDLLCELPRLKGWKGTALLDVKRSLYAGPVIGLQLAAYRAIVESDKGMPRVSRRGALRIGVDGKFQIEPYDDPTDLATFIALLTLKRWREKHAVT